MTSKIYMEIKIKEIKVEQRVVVGCKIINDQHIPFALRID
jgi:hypothetical protein